MPKPRGPRDDERAREPRVDHRIRVPEVLVIDADGTKLGVMPTHEALRRAQEQNLNLVEVAAASRPPVCKIVDYGKLKYQNKKREKEKKHHQVVIEVKEVKFRPKIEKHDFEFKLKHVQRFLSEGDKVKATMMFRGRELAHTELGEIMLKRLLGHLEGKVVVEQNPRLEGRNMTMLLAPKPGAWPKKEKAPLSDKKIREDEDVNAKEDAEEAEEAEEAAVSGEATDVAEARP